MRTTVLPFPVLQLRIVILPLRTIVLLWGRRIVATKFFLEENLKSCKRNLVLECEAWVCLKKQDGSVYCVHCTYRAGWVKWIFKAAWLSYHQNDRRKYTTDSFLLCIYISNFLANSLGEVCSHVAAVIFKIQTAVMLGLTKHSSTSEACPWNKTFRENVGQFWYL